MELQKIEVELALFCDGNCTPNVCAGRCMQCDQDRPHALAPMILVVARANEVLDPPAPDGTRAGKMHWVARRVVRRGRRRAEHDCDRGSVSSGVDGLEPRPRLLAAPSLALAAANEEELAEILAEEQRVMEPRAAWISDGIPSDTRERFTLTCPRGHSTQVTLRSAYAKAAKALAQGRTSVLL